jgi:hypothetical protein
MDQAGAARCAAGAVSGVRFSLADSAPLFCSAENSTIRTEIGGVLPVTCGMALHDVARRRPGDESRRPADRPAERSRIIEEWVVVQDGKILPPSLLGAKTEKHGKPS